MLLQVFSSAVGPSEAAWIRVPTFSILCCTPRFRNSEPERKYVFASKAIELHERILGGTWDLVSRVISTLIGVVTRYNYSYLTYSPITKSHDPLSNQGHPDSGANKLASTTTNDGPLFRSRFEI